MSLRIRNHHAIQLIWTCCLSLVSVRLKSWNFWRLLVTISAEWLFRCYCIIHKFLLCICCSQRKVKTLRLLMRNLSMRSKISCCIIFAGTFEGWWTFLITLLSRMWIIDQRRIIWSLIELLISHGFLPMYGMLFNFKIITFVCDWSFDWAITRRNHRKLLQTSFISRIFNIVWMLCSPTSWVVSKYIRICFVIKQVFFILC